VRSSTVPPTCSSSSSGTGAGTPGPRWAPPTCRWARWSRSPPSSGSSPSWSARTSRGSAYPRRVLTASLSVVLLDAPIRLNYGIAFAAGLLSFLSPCVFPLLPPLLLPPAPRLPPLPRRPGRDGGPPAGRRGPGGGDPGPGQRSAAPPGPGAGQRGGRRRRLQRRLHHPLLRLHRAAAEPLHRPPPRLRRRGRDRGGGAR